MQEAIGRSDRQTEQAGVNDKKNDLRGSEEDDVEGLHHGRGKAQVSLLVQNVSQGTEDLLRAQQQG